MRRNQLLKIIAIIGTILSILVLVLIGACAQPAPVTTPTTAPVPAPTTAPSPGQIITPAITPTPTTAPTQAPSQKVYVLKWSSGWVSGIPLSNGHKWFIEEMKKRSGGRIQVEEYWAGTIAPAAETLTAISQGAADFAIFMQVYEPSKVPLLTVGALPALAFDNWANMMSSKELYETEPLMSQELAKWNARYMTGGSATTNWGLFGTKPMNSIADLKGLKVRASGGQQAVLQALGAVPVAIPGPQQIEALIRGTVDAVTIAPGTLMGYKAHEMAGPKYWYPISLGIGWNHLLVINLNTWNRLPADLQKIIKDIDEDNIDAFAKSYWINDDGQGLDLLKQAGTIISTPTAADNARVRQIAETEVWTKWVKDMEAQGLPGQKILNQWLEINKKYQQISPYKNIVKEWYGISS